MSSIIILLQFSFVLIVATYICCHQNANYQNVVGNEQPHIHDASPPAKGQDVPNQPAQPVGLWDQYGRIDFMHDLDHLKEEASKVLYMQKNEQITNDQSAFYYTKLHDFNSDGKLDGLELLLAVKHSLTHHNSSLEHQPLEDFQIYVDTELKLMDQNNDGFVDYGEIYTYMEDNKKTNQQQNQPQTHS